MNCKNCDQIVGGNFCTHCGQSTKIDKVNLPNFVRELSDSVFQINKGFFYTLKALFVRPGHSKYFALINSVNFRKWIFSIDFL